MLVVLHQMHDTCLHAACDPVDDLGHVASDLGHGLAAEERRVVVVAPELADDEQGVVQVALAIYTTRSRFIIH